jgi:hypothetical protein
MRLSEISDLWKRSFPMNDICADKTFFQLEQVVEGVYFAQALPGTGTLGNAAIVDLGDVSLSAC